MSATMRRVFGLPSRNPRTVLGLILRSPAALAVAMILIISAIFVPSLYNSNNLMDQLRLAAILGIVTLGQMLVLLGRGFDLSVGATMGLTATMVTQFSTNVGAALSISLLVGLLIGALNASLIVLRGVPPFIATLGVMILVAGLRVAYTKGATSGGVQPELRNLALGSVGTIPNPLILWLVIALILLVILHVTIPGYWLYAAGRSPRTARLTGVPVRVTVAATYVVCGVLAALAGTLQAGYTGYVDQYLGSGVELSSIAAAVIGGTTFAGGEGGVVGTIAGALLLTLLVNVVNLLNLGTAMGFIVQGAVLLIAIAMQTLRSRKPKVLLTQTD